MRRGDWHGHRRHGRSRGPLRRSSGTRVLAGVCGGLARTAGFDVMWVRIAFVLLTLGSGVGIVLYALAWLFIPLDGDSSNIISRALADRRGIRLVIAIVPAFVLVQVVAASLSIAYVGSFSWPVFVACGAAILIKRNAGESEAAWIDGELAPMLSTGAEHHARWRLVFRVLLGALLAVGGLLILVSGHRVTAALRPVGGAVLVVAAIVVVFGPWWLGLLRDLMAERQARARAEERAQMAAHVHDSVLQTLALIQRSAGEPTQVVRLARAQERELRAWLFEGRPPGVVAEHATTLGEGLITLQQQVEGDHGITVELVAVGDCELTDGLRALLEAAREATVNAAKWSEAPTVSLYAEVEHDAVWLFVRDRGRGFDPDSVPTGRRGIAHSIRDRMAHFGGSAVIRSSPGSGTEVELSVPRREPVR